MYNVCTRAFKDAGISRELANTHLTAFVQGLQAPSPVSQSANDQVWRDEELARALQVRYRDCLTVLH